MIELQQIFNDCKAIYKKAYDVVDTVAKTDWSENPDGESTITPSDITRSFDVCLQYSLLQLAISSGELHVNEMIFIRDLTRRGDLINYVNGLIPDQEGFEWENLPSWKIADLEDLMELLYKPVLTYSLTFIMMFKASDMIHKEVDLASILDDLISTIGHGLCFMDGDEDSNDPDTDLLILSLLRNENVSIPLD